MPFLSCFESNAPLHCVCYDRDEDCVCCPAERGLRAFARPGNTMPPMTTVQREACLQEIASVEGYTRQGYVTATDQDLAIGVLHALADYCLDKGLL